MRPKKWAPADHRLFRQDSNVTIQPTPKETDAEWLARMKSTGELGVTIQATPKKLDCTGTDLIVQATPRIAKIGADVQSRINARDRANMSKNKVRPLPTNGKASPDQESHKITRSISPHGVHTPEEWETNLLR